MIENDIIDIDGSFGEGGGSILRLSAGYSILFNQPIRVYNIRANRPKPGLRMQHLLGLKILAELTNSYLSQCEVGTKEIILIPNRDHIIKTKIHVNINTSASIGLLLQPIQIACMGFNNPNKIEMNLEGGGTFGKWAPSLNYLNNVTYQIFKKSGLSMNLEIGKYGFYPKGGAKTNCTILLPQEKLNPINLTELGNLDLIQGEIILTNHLRQKKSNIGERIKNTIISLLKKTQKIETYITYKWVNSESPGVGLSLWANSDIGAIISTGTILGEKNLTSEKLGEFAVKEILKYVENDIPVDNYLSDQLIPLMAYVKNPSRIKILEVTNHVKTNLELIKLFTNREYNILKENNSYIIEYL